MDYVFLKDALADPSSAGISPFTMLREIARHVNVKTTHNQGRDLVIRALAVADIFSPEEREILTSLVRSVGLFPYMTDRLASSSIEDLLAYELHRAENMDGEIIFHSLQAKIFNQLMCGANVVLSASTSVGKSLVVDALVSSGKYRKIVVVVPTIALIDETRRRLLSRFGERCCVITHPSQQANTSATSIYVLTQERVLQRKDLDDVNLFVIDEFYKMNLDAEKESSRAVDLNLAFHKLAKQGAQFYLLGPNIQIIKGLDKYEYHFIPSEFSTVAVDVTNFNLPTHGDQRKDKLLELCRAISEPTIVYCQSPRSASEVATLLANRAGFPISPATDHAVAWIGDHYHPDWAVCKALRHGIGIHHGGIPRALQQYFIRLFNERKILILVCTSTIIEGVNTVAKNVIIYDRRKSKDVLDHFTYKNIEGRAGRMKEYFIGRVFVLETAPSDEMYSVDVPISTQGPETPISLLLDLDADDLTETSRDRLSTLFGKSTLAPDTLRSNRHTPADVQEQIAAAIRADLLQYEDALTWTGVPTASQLNAVCDLIYDFLEGGLLRDYGVHSGGELAWHLNALRMGQTLSDYIRQCIRQKRSDQTPGEVVENELRFLRNVVCQNFPRHLMVVSNIQRDVFTRKGVRPGDYTLFAEQSENLFMPSILFALDEYGVPLQTAQQLMQRLLPAQSLDDVLSHLMKLPIQRLGLSKFEIEVLEDIRRTIRPRRTSDGATLI